MFSPRPAPPARLVGRLAAPFRGGGLAPRNRRETAAMSVALAAMALALGLEAAEALTAPAAPDPAALAAAAAASPFRGEVCPDGWAALAAAASSLTEAELSAWYVAESFHATDAAVIDAAVAFLRAPGAAPSPAGPPAEVQVALCVAESRRLL